MKKFILPFVLLFISCTSREEAIIEFGGKPPIACIDLKTNFIICKDTRKLIFICNSGVWNIECISTAIASYAFSQVEL